MNNLKKHVDAAMGRIKADLVLKNVSIINVFTQEIEVNDVAIVDNKIIGIGKYFGEKELDCTGKYVTPGFINGHVHIESSMVTPEVFSQLAIRKGETTSVVDPHEIANVLGEDGIKFMLENSKKGVTDLLFMLPSCVPATPVEDNGALLNAKELSQFIDDERVLGLGEVMDVPSVVNANGNMLDKVEMAMHKNIDGHCPSILDNELNAYLSCEIKTDHECATYKEALEKVKRGMYVLLREGTATKNLIDLLPAINNNNYQRFLFCTDDRHIDDMMVEGTIDNAVRIAIREGMDPVRALTIASYNAAACYGLKNKGAVAPGFIADLIIFDDLNKIDIKYVIKDGRIYDEEISYSKQNVKPSMNINEISVDCFKVEAKSKCVNVIKLIPHSVETLSEKKKVIVEGQYVKKVEGDDILKVAVFERHKNTGKYSVGYLSGLGLKNCAIAQTISHDSHNIIVVGDNDKDMEVAVNALIKSGGGITMASEGKVLGSVELPIAGLMTSEDPHVVSEKVKGLAELGRKYGVKDDFDPFLTLGFMSLGVIPSLKITPRGLFEYSKFDFIDLFC